MGIEVNLNSIHQYDVFVQNMSEEQARINLGEAGRKSIEEMIRNKMVVALDQNIMNMMTEQIINTGTLNAAHIANIMKPTPGTIAAPPIPVSIFTEEQIQQIIKVKKALFDYVERTCNELAFITGKNLNFNNWFVTGGCIGSLLRGEPVNDWDFFCHNDATVAIGDIFSSPPKHGFVDMSNLIEATTKTYNTSYGPETKTTLNKNSYGVKLKTGQNLVTYKFGKPEEVVAGFDFINCMPWYDLRNNKLHITKQQYDLCRSKTLMVNPKFLGPVATYRFDKYLKAGWKIADTTPKKN